jgi:methyl-accepting chemotaxis protein
VGNDSESDGFDAPQETDPSPTQEEAHVTPHDDATLENSSYDQPSANGNGGGSTEALDALLNQIAAGTGNLRAQVDELTESLETTQRELREANEQLAEATRVKEEHDELVAGMRAEVEHLRAELERSNAMNSSMTSRLEEVARALSVPAANDEHGTA